MGSNTVEAVKEIEQTRERIGSTLNELEERLPAPAKVAKKAAGVALGGGVGGTLFWFAVRRARGKRKKTKVVQAVQPVIQVLPDDLAERFDAAMKDGRAKAWAAGVGAAWTLFRLMELRQLRRLRRVVS